MASDYLHVLAINHNISTEIPNTLGSVFQFFLFLDIHFLQILQDDQR